MRMSKMHGSLGNDIVLARLNSELYSLLERTYSTRLDKLTPKRGVR